MSLAGRQVILSFGCRQLDRITRCLQARYNTDPFNERRNAIWWLRIRTSRLGLSGPRRRSR